MDTLDHFSIPVLGLRNGLHEFDFAVEDDFFQHFENSPITRANVQVHLDFDKRPDLYVLVFSMSGTVKVTCDRCLDEFDLPIEDRQSLMVKFDEEEWEEADVIYILREKQMLNVARFIYEFINLAVPMIKTHDDAGESCNPEMLKYLDEKEEEPEPTSNPFKDAFRDLNFDN